MKRNQGSIWPKPSRQAAVIVGLFALVIVTAIFVAACGSATTTTTTGSPATTAGSSTTAGATSTTAAGATSTSAASGGAQVTLQNIAIDPTSVIIKAGESVTWTNKDSFAHHLVGDKGEFDSADMAAGATFAFTFKTAGTITYHCSIHPEMTGTVIVQ